MVCISIKQFYINTTFRWRFLSFPWFLLSTTADPSSKNCILIPSPPLPYPTGLNPFRPPPLTTVPTHPSCTPLPASIPDPIPTPNHCSWHPPPNTVRFPIPTLLPLFGWLPIFGRFVTSGFYPIYLLFVGLFLHAFGASFFGALLTPLSPNQQQIDAPFLGTYLWTTLPCHVKLSLSVTPLAFGSHFFRTHTWGDHIQVPTLTHGVADPDEAA